MFLQNTPKDWARQARMNAYDHNPQPLSPLNVSRQKIVPKILLTFDMNLYRDLNRTLKLNWQNILNMTKQT